MNVPPVSTSQGYRHQVKMTDGALVSWDEGNLVCTCPAGKRKAGQIVSLCRHTDRCIEVKNDNLIFKDNPPLILQVPIAPMKVLELEWDEKPKDPPCWSYYLHPVPESPDLYQADVNLYAIDRLHGFRSPVDIGMVHSRNSRSDLIEATLPYALDWAMGVTCTLCAVNPTAQLMQIRAASQQGGLRQTKWQLSLVLYATHIACHAKGLCAYHHLLTMADE